MNGVAALFDRIVIVDWSASGTPKTGRDSIWICAVGRDGAEKRLIDRWMVGAQSCWKLAYTGSVGSQALTGIPVVRALHDDAAWADRARIWPFETGFSLPDDAQIVFAEIWPSWWPIPSQSG